MSNSYGDTITSTTVADTMNKNGKFWYLSGTGNTKTTGSSDCEHMEDRFKFFFLMKPVLNLEAPLLLGRSCFFSECI